MKTMTENDVQAGQTFNAKMNHVVNYASMFTLVVLIVSFVFKGFIVLWGLSVIVYSLLFALRAASIYVLSEVSPVAPENDKTLQAAWYGSGKPTGVTRNQFWMLTMPMLLLPYAVGGLAGLFSTVVIGIAILVHIIVVIKAASIMSKKGYTSSK